MSRKKVVYNPISRRSFLHITGSMWIAIPYLSVFSKGSYAQSNQKSWVINCMIPEGNHPLNFFQNPNIFNSWQNLTDRIKHTNLQSNHTSNIFNSTVMSDSVIRSNLTLAYGLGQNSPSQGTHDWALFSSMWGNGGWGAGGDGSSDSSFSSLPLDTYDKKLFNIIQSKGKSIKRLNFSYTNTSGGSNRHAGKVSAGGSDGNPEQGKWRLSDMYEQVFGMPSTGGSGGTNNPTLDRSKFLDMGLQAIQKFMSSSRLPASDKNTLQKYQDVIVPIRNSLKPATTGGGQTNPSTTLAVNIPNNLANLDGITSVSNTGVAENYLSLWRNLIVASIVNGSNTIVNIGNFVPLVENFQSGTGAGPKVVSDIHNDSHSNTWGSIDDSLSKNANQLNYTKGIYKHIVFKLAKELNQYDMLSSGCIYTANIYDDVNGHWRGTGKKSKGSLGLHKSIIGKANGFFNGGKIFDFRRTLSNGDTNHQVDSIINASIFQSFGASKSDYNVHPKGGYGFYRASNLWGGYSGGSYNGLDDLAFSEWNPGDPFPVV